MRITFPVLCRQLFSKYVFLVGGQGKRRHEPLSYHALAKLFARHCEHLGIRDPWVTPHAFAHALAEHFTVHIIERRGRGESSPQGDDYSIAKEREDILALQQKTGASLLVGHSFGNS